MEKNGHVAVFWDFENCPPPTSTTGYDTVHKIRRAVEAYGTIVHFKAYLDVLQSAGRKSATLYSQLQSSGVTMAHCPHSGKKDVVDKMILVDMITYTIINPSQFTIVLITGDRDFAYGVATLRLRGYEVVVIVPPSVHNSILSLATVALKWQSDVINPVIGEKDLSAIKAPSTPSMHCYENSTSQGVETAPFNIDTGSMERNKSLKETSESWRISDLFTFINFIQMLFPIFNDIVSVCNTFCGALKMLCSFSSYLETENGRVASDVDISAADKIFHSENGFSHSHSEADDSDEKLIDCLLPLKFKTPPQVTRDDERAQCLTRNLTICANLKDPVDEELDVMYYDALDTQDILVNSDNESQSCEVDMTSMRSHADRHPAFPAFTTLAKPNVIESSADDVSEPSGSAVVSRAVPAAVITDFKPLIQILKGYPGKRAKRAKLAAWINENSPGFYQKVGVSGKQPFTKYINAAVSKSYVTVERNFVILSSMVA